MKLIGVVHVAVQPEGVGVGVKSGLYLTIKRSTNSERPPRWPVLPIILCKWFLGFSKAGIQIMN